MSDLDERVTQFMMLELPGQPQMMHMGTSRLVSDLHAEVKRLRAAKQYAKLATYGSPAAIASKLDSWDNLKSNYIDVKKERDDAQCIANLALDVEEYLFCVVAALTDANEALPEYVMCTLHNVYDDMSNARDMRKNLETTNE